jgi:hypothetical protein
MPNHVCGPNCTPQKPPFTCWEVTERTEGGSTITTLHLTDEAKQGLSVGTATELPATPPAIHPIVRASSFGMLTMLLWVVSIWMETPWFMWPILAASALAFTVLAWAMLESQRPPDQVPPARVVRR